MSIFDFRKYFTHKTLLFSILTFASTLNAAIPPQPMGVTQPGSADYIYSLGQTSFKISGREIQVYYPQEMKSNKIKAPVLVFGHGQAIGASGYELTFKHLARKGVVVIHPNYDRGFFDLDWKRMSTDYISLTSDVLSKISEFADEQRVMFAGHSKGGFVALISAGNPALSKTNMKVGAVVAFSPIGFDKTYISSLPKDLPVSLFWSESESIVRQSKIEQIFEMVPSLYKQMIVVKDYPDMKAGHFMTLNKSYFFGGSDGVSPYHYHGVWKWLLGGISDLENHQRTNPYLYGSEALTTGVENLTHTALRTW